MNLPEQNQRLWKGLHESFFILEVTTANDVIEVKISGSQRHVYTVKVDEKRNVSCNCPDLRSKALRLWCKHICFILFKVAKVDQQKANDRTIDDSDKDALGQTLKKCWTTATYVNEDLVKAFNSLNVTTTARNAGDMCPICFEDLGSKNIVICATCKNGLHQKCASKWFTHSKACVFCRTQQESHNGTIYMKV
jgi:hypothetical protein